MKPYKILEHTADVALCVYGRSLNELFVNAAKGLMSFITDEKKITVRKGLLIKLKENNIEELFVSWLNELIFLFSAKSFLSKKFKIEYLDNCRLKATVLGEKFNEKKHIIDTEIKAVTYHELEIKKKRQYWQAKVILDT